MRNIFAKYLNIPYKSKGRDFSGVDCYGLLLLIFKEEKNIILPDYTENKELREWYHTKDVHVLDNIAKLWRPVKNEEFKVFDVHNFLDEHHILSHVGINIGDFKFLHVLDDRFTEIGKIDVWAKRLVFTMRYVGDA